MAKIYRCETYNKRMEYIVTWHSSERDAKMHLREIKSERNAPAPGPEGVATCDVPLNKAGLIQWLNDSNMRSAP